MANIGILGAGTWGTALAWTLCLAGHAVTVWAHRDAETLSRERRHKNLPGVELPRQIRFTGDITEACAGQEIVIMAVPSVYVRRTAALAAGSIAPGTVVADAAKGLEETTLMTMTQVIADELRKAGRDRGVALVALSGPTHAEEVAADLPTTIVSAGVDPEAAGKVQRAFADTCIRAYTNDDVLGVELCGAVKNVVAIAAGISAGLGYGDNGKAALVTRGMAEIKRLGVSLGCREQTFSGLAGIGDLVVTATSRHSRNNRCGFLIGQGMRAPEAVREVGMVVEGVNALAAVHTLAQRQGVDMPISQAVWEIVFNGADPRQAVLGLMRRDMRSEME